MMIQELLDQQDYLVYVDNLTIEFNGQTVLRKIL